MIPQLLGLFAAVVARTLRIVWTGDALPERAVVMFWHGQMFVGWWSVRKRKPVALVSKSKDGAILARVLQRWGYLLARGSSGKQGREALQVAIDHVRSGDARTLAITPDGPRGPRHELKRGGVIAAHTLHIPLVFLHIRPASRKVFWKSWDKFEVPLPFSKVVIEVEQLDVTSWPEDYEEQIAWLNNLSIRLEHADEKSA